MNKKHLNNLKKLSKYMHEHYGDRKRSKRFDMESYCYKLDSYNNEMGLTPQNWECGTSMCLAGHGPEAGIKVKGADECWSQYTKRVFGLDSAYRSSTEPLWEFLFAAYWPSNIQLALKRLDFVIEHQRAPHEWSREDRLTQARKWK